MDRVILHVDMDEFFAAIEKLDNPSLRGKALLIGGDPSGRGVVSTASYEARPYGCGSAMPMALAVRRCPHAIVLPVRGQRYAAVSEQVFKIFRRYSPLVEPLSIDEAFIDVTGSQRLFGTGGQIARAIKQDIHSEIGLTASVGLAPNKFLAKLASDLEKPDGLTVIPPDGIQDALDPLEIRKLWGVGPAAEKRLHAMGIRTVAQLRRAGREYLRSELGQLGQHLDRLARGEDLREVVADHSAKSIGQETTFPRDIDEPEFLRNVLLGQVEQVARRIRRHGLTGRTVTLKIRTGDFNTITRSRTLDEPTDVTAEIWSGASALFQAWAKRDVQPLRLLGVTVSNLQGRAGRQMSLFCPTDRRRQGQLDATLDRIAEKFGTGAIHRGPGRPNCQD
jgi:DNA polymerase-4